MHLLHVPDTKRSISYFHSSYIIDYIVHELPKNINIRYKIDIQFITFIYEYRFFLQFIIFCYCFLYSEKVKRLQKNSEEMSFFGVQKYTIISYILTQAFSFFYFPTLLINGMIIPPILLPIVIISRYITVFIDQSPARLK